MGTYSFLSVSASINGPGGAFALGQGSGAAEEGITIAMAAEKNTMTPGADGSGMHSLRASNAGKVKVRLLKTSPVNQQLSQMYALQKSTPALWGQNVFLLNDSVRGDVVAARECAFAKLPDLTYATEGGINEWEFDAIHVDEQLGSGSPVLA